MDLKELKGWTDMFCVKLLKTILKEGYTRMIVLLQFNKAGMTLKVINSF